MVKTLVSGKWLEAHLNDPDIRILEVSSELDDKTYREGHIPGAVRWFWKEKCWHASDRQFITPQETAEHLGQIGVSPSTQLVIYGDPVQYGTYAYWALTMGGHSHLHLLDGSRKKWIKEGRPLTRNIPRFDPVKYKPGKADLSMRLGRDDVRAKLGKAGRMLIDARSPEEYSGQRVMEIGKFDHGAERTGRIPGAVHLFFKELLNDDDSYKSPQELQAVFDSVGANPKKIDEIVVYCRLSHRATFLWVGLTQILGYKNVKIYDGSWTEWGSIVGFPIER
ncbi:MAG: sulfurtransferase [SAR324 cluster bacterium]|nr:sulfurtransferase [SAR324 cluster bacterium]